MTTPAPQMTRAELTAYAAAHENEYVQQYVEAVHDEHAEVTSQLNAIVRRGYSADGREAMRKVRRILLFVAVMVIAYFMGTLEQLTRVRRDRSVVTGRALFPMSG